MWLTNNAFFCEMQFWSYCYLVVSYQALFKLSVCKIPAVYLSGAKNVFLHETRLWLPDYNGKVTTSQLDITNGSQEVSPFPVGDHKASINRCARKHNKNKTEIT